MAFCSQLFKLEEQFKDLPPEERKDKRLEQEKPVLDAMQAWANTRNAAPKSKLGIALNYLKNQWTELNAYLQDQDRKVEKDGRPVGRALTQHPGNEGEHGDQKEPQRISAQPSLLSSFLLH